MHFALSDMSNVIEPSINATYLGVPEPLDASDLRSSELYPWRSFINRYHFLSSTLKFTLYHSLIQKPVQKKNTFKQSNQIKTLNENRLYTYVWIDGYMNVINSSFIQSNHNITF